MCSHLSFWKGEETILESVFALLKCAYKTRIPILHWYCDGWIVTWSTTLSWPHRQLSWDSVQNLRKSTRAFLKTEAKKISEAQGRKATWSKWDRFYLMVLAHWTSLYFYFCCCCFFETQFLCVSLVVLEHVLKTRLASNSEIHSLCPQVLWLKVCAAMASYFIFEDYYVIKLKFI